MRIIVLPLLFLIFSVSIVGAAQEDESILIQIWNGVQSLLGLGGGDPISYEYLTAEEHLHTWNQNPYEDRRDIWFNGSTGYLQFFNGINKTDALERSKWLTHRFGLGYYKPSGAFEEFSKSQINDYEKSIYSDNATVWRQFVWKCFNFTTPANKREFCTGFKRAQNLTAEYMKNNLFFSVNATQAPFNFNKMMYYTWGFENISIENDAVQDYVIYCNMTGATFINDSNMTEHFYYERCDSFELDGVNKSIDNTTQLQILDGTTHRGHNVFYAQPNVKLDYSGDIKLISPLGLLTNFSGINQVKMWWIDYAEDNFIVDRYLDVSGYIEYKTVGATKYKNWSNTNAKIGYDNNPLLGYDREYRGYWSFNVSSVPKYVNISNVSFGHLVVAFSTDKPTDWESSLYIGTTEIVDDYNNLSGATDWEDGYAVSVGGSGGDKLIDWDDYCGANNPCGYNFIIGDYDVGTFPNETAIIFMNKTIQDETEWYFVSMRDNSTYSPFDNKEWTHTTWIIHPRPERRCNLTVEYTLLNKTMDESFISPVNNTEYIMSNGTAMQVNLSVYSKGLFNLSWCDFNLSGTVVRNDSLGDASGADQNITVSQNFTVTVENDGYNWSVNCSDERGLLNSTYGPNNGLGARRYFNVTVNDHPVVSGAVGLIPASPLTTDNLNCSATITDDLIGGESLIANYTWYKDTIADYISNVSLINNTINSTNLSSGNTSKGEVWICGVTPHDALLLNGTQVNSTSVTIQNSLPGNVTLVQPLNNSYLDNISPNFVWETAIDNDSDSLTYQIQIDDDIDFSSTDYDVSGITDLFYKDSVALNHTQVYFWRVRANDGTGDGPWVTRWNFTTQINDPAVVQSISLTPAAPLTTDNLNCSYTITDDPFNGTILAEMRWYKDGALDGTATNYTALNNTLNSTELSSASTSKGEVWICGVTPYDNVTNGTQLNASSVTIQNSLPGNVTLVSPLNASNLTNSSPNFLWEAAIDNDSDTLTYQLQIDDDIDFLSTDLDVSGIPDVNYTNQITLNNSQEYNWRVRANDGVGDGQWVTYWNFTTYTPVVGAGSVNVTLVSPISLNYTRIDVLHNDTIVNFTYNVSSKFNVSNCTLWINRSISNYTHWYNESLNYTNYTITQNSTNMFRILINQTGNYSWQVNCSDNGSTPITGQAGLETTLIIGHEIYIYGIFFVAICCLLIVGEKKKNWILMTIAGVFMLIVGLYTFTRGIPGDQVSWFASGYATGWIFYSAFILIGLGLFYIFRAVYANVWGFEDGD